MLPQLLDNKDHLDFLSALIGEKRWGEFWDSRFFLWRDDVAFKLCEKCGTHTMRLALFPLGFAAARAVWPPPVNIHFICRNPYARAVSVWYDTVYNCREENADRIKAWGGRGFKDYVRFITSGQEQGTASIHKTQTEWIGATPIDGFIRLEQLGTELPKLVPGLESVPREHASGHKSWRTYYDTEAARLIGEWAAEDFVRFGYERQR